MKANELRIGNLVNYYMGAPMSENILTKVEWKDLKNIGSGDKNYEPIPLTFEWLKRFGFDGYEESGYFEKRGFFFYVGTCKDGSYYLEHPDSGHFVGQPINHVHQLENLYFALTGEELTLNN